MSSDPKLISHTLNNGALLMLANLLNAAGLLTDAKDLRHAGDVAELPPLLELPKIPEFPDSMKNEIDRLAHVRTWQRDAAHVLDLKSTQRDAIRKLIKAGLEKGAGRPGPDTSCLLREFGVGDE
jgi:hypothetical protein